MKKTDADLLIQKDLPLEVRLEILDFGGDIFLDHSVERDPELVQLGLERGQLGSLLQMKPFPNLVKALLIFKVKESTFPNYIIIIINILWFTNCKLVTKIIPRDRFNATVFRKTLFLSS